MSIEARAAAPRLAFEQVTRRHDGISVIDALSFKVESGAFVALIGASGSGKSSLLRLVNRLDTPDEGRVTLDERDVAGLDPIALRRSIGTVFQHVGLFPHMTIAENIGIAPRLAGGVPVDVAAALARVGLPPELAQRMPATLSGGQQQRVGIARALAGEKRMLLMDEPFGALDPVTRDSLGRTVRDLHDSLGLTTLFVTHDMAEALLLADRVAVMDGGRIVADATPAQLLAGAAGPAAEALVKVPREQAARLAALAG